MSRIRANNFTDKAGTGAPTFPNGVNVTGVSTFGNVVVGGATTDVVINGDLRVTGIITAGTSSITIDSENDQITVGSATTIHSTGYQIGSSNLHSTGLEVQNINVSGVVTTTTLKVGTGVTISGGIVTATTYYGSGANLTGIDATQIQTGNTSVQTVDTGSDGHVKITTEGIEAARFDSSRRLLVGTTMSASTGDAQYSKLQVKGNTFSSAEWGSLAILSDNLATSGLSNNNLVGGITFADSIGSRFCNIQVAVDGTPGDNDYPGRLVFSTTQDSESSPRERWRITNEGILTNQNGNHAHGNENFISDYRCQFGSFASAESGTNGQSAVGSGPFDSTFKNSEWNNKTLTYGMVNSLKAEYNLSQASRCNIGAHFYVTNAGGGDYSFPTGGSGSSYWTPNGAAIWAAGDGGGGYVGYAAIRADVASRYSSGAAFYARVINGVTSGVGYGYHCDLGGHPFGARQVGFYVRQIDNNNQQGNAGYVYKRHNTSNTFWVMQVENGAGSTIGGITCTNTNTAFPTSSDYRLKENVVPLTGAVERLKQIPVHRFNFIASPEVTQDGFLAHELQPVVPIAVSGTKDEVKNLPKKDENDNFVYEEGEDGEKIPVMEEVPEYQTVDYSKVVPLLTAALQEALDKIDALQARLDAAGL